MTRPEFETLYKEIEKFDFFKTSSSKSSDSPASEKPRKIYYSFRTKQLQDTKPNDPFYYTIKTLRSGTYLRTHYKMTIGFIKKVFTEINFTQKRLEIRTKEEWENTKKSRSVANELEQDIIRKLQGKESIIQCFDIIRKENIIKGFISCQYFLEYCNGGTLYHAYSHLTETERFIVLRDALTALNLLHKEYIDFDLHFGNILVEIASDGTVSGKLIDFGNARKIVSISSTENLIKSTIRNKAWTANATAYSPEMLVHLFQYRLEQLTKDMNTNNNNSKKIINKVSKLDKEAVVALSGKTDIWQLGLNFARYYYNIEMETHINNGKSKILSCLNSPVESDILPYFLQYFPLLPHSSSDYRNMPLARLEKIISALKIPYLAPKNANPVHALIFSMLQYDTEKRFSALDCVKYINTEILTQNSKDEIPEVDLNLTVSS